MKPGRELDKLVAKVFGWKEWEFSNPGRDGQEAFRYTTLVPPEYDGSGLQYLNMIIPHYSTDIREAMVAWEWLEQNHPWKYDVLCLGKPSEYDRNGQPAGERPQVFRVTSGWPCDNIELIAVGESYPHAICLAVLAVIEGKK